MDKDNKADEFNPARNKNLKGFSVVASSEKKKKGFVWPLIKFIFRLIITLIIIFALMNTFFPNFTKKVINEHNIEFLKKVVEAEETGKSKKVIPAPSTNSKGYSNAAQGVASKVLPSIVGIELEYGVKTVFNREISATASGSGIIISEDGYILTNNHVVSPGQKRSGFFEISEVEKLFVTLHDEKTPIEAKIIGVDKLTDLAVIKIDKKGLTAAKLGDSDQVQIGEFAMAVGNPLGLKGSVTAGIISAVNREVEMNDGQQFNTLQTDASINEGNSGGALVNKDGEVIGINTLKIGGNGIEGIGFAIPINQTKEIYKSLIENGKVLRPSIGIEGYAVEGDLKVVLGVDGGVLVARVMDNSSAANAGIKKSDVIVGFNGKEVKSVGDLNQLKTGLKEGDEVDIKIIRSGEEKTLKMKMLLEKPENNNEKKENTDKKDNKKEESKENQRNEEKANAEESIKEATPDNFFESFFSN